VLSEVFSFWQNRRWRRFMVSRTRVPRNGRVLDAATGTAAVAIELVLRTGARVVGLDQSEPMLRRGVEAVAGAGLESRVVFVLGQGERLPFPDLAFDAVTFTYLLRYVDDPAATLAELARVLKPGGTMANLEFHVPPNPLWRGLWWIYTRVGLPLAGRLVSKAWHEVGRFLGPSIRKLYEAYPLPKQLDVWRAVGVSNVRARVMSLGGGVVIWGTKDATDGH
jgi:demethylmenaquinone methyltransferase/2-methoxy-6-polyprenyl-1,4-benzoquinol methylase